MRELPPGFDLGAQRNDTIATARQQFGAAAVDRALRSETYLIAKRFAGMLPPPPPGTPSDWRPPTPTAMLIREGSEWLVATSSGWRAAKADAGADLDRLIADRTFWSEPVYTQACPDYGAQLLLLKLHRRPETFRNSQCTSKASEMVEAALRA
jgi:hypothetical protein